MHYLVLVGRYLGVRPGTEITDPVVEMADPQAPHAVLQVPEGLLPAPAKWAPVLEIASRAPFVEEAHAALGAVEHDPDVSFAALAEQEAMFVLDSEDPTLPEHLWDDLFVVPGRPMVSLDPPGDGTGAVNIGHYDVDGQRLTGFRDVAQALATLGPDGATVRQVGELIEAQHPQARPGSGVAQLTTNFRALLKSGAIDVMLRA